MRLGITWYRNAADYEALLALCYDRDGMHDRYEEWLADAERLEYMSQSKGIETVRAYLDPATFLTWCKENGCKPNAEGRSRYGSQYSATYREMTHGAMERFLS